MPPLIEHVTADQAAELALALEIMRLADREDGVRRSVYGLNRAAQQRLPGQDIWIGKTEMIVRAWEIAGWATLTKSILEPKIDLGGGQLTYSPVNHILKSLAIVAVSDLADSEEVFLAVNDGGRTFRRNTYQLLSCCSRN